MLFYCDGYCDEDQIHKKRMNTMDSQQYGQYLLALGGEEMALEKGEMVEDYHLYGFFQWFMPKGEGIEQIFKPLPNGEMFLNRIRPLYEMIDPADFSGGSVPGYFNGAKEEASTDVLYSHARQLLEGFRRLLTVGLEHDDENEIVDEALEILQAITEVELLPVGEINHLAQQDADEEDEGSIIYDAISDVISSSTDYDEAIQILSEGYYSITCDYWVSYYLQWPRYQELKGVGDPFAPYFELYRLGYTVIFSSGKLLIGKK